MGAEKLYTSSEVGDLLQVDASSIVKWVNDGLLNAYRTPGGHRRIRSSDVVTFLRKHRMYIPPELETERRKVLFVDDDGHVLGGMKRAMKSHADKVEFLTAQSGIEAMVMIAADRPDVIVIYFGMPNLDGLELISQLKSRPETQSIEVVLVSGCLTKDLEKRAMAMGAKAVRNKPLSATDLLTLSSIRASA